MKQGRHGPKLVHRERAEKFRRGGLTRNTGFFTAGFVTKPSASQIAWRETPETGWGVGVDDGPDRKRWR